MHDPQVYKEPHEFNPDRFIRDGKIDPDIRDPFQFAFGFGRRYAETRDIRTVYSTHTSGVYSRICPGRYFARAALFINIASALHVFDIGPPTDEQGQPIEVQATMSDGLTSYVPSAPHLYLTFCGANSCASTITIGFLRIAGVPSNPARLVRRP